ncbi:MAG: hypothetical protein ACLUGJ_10510 [Blautia wexlerae]
MKELNLKHEAKRYGCAVLAATIMALNIKTFVRAGGLFSGRIYRTYSADPEHFSDIYGDCSSIYAD